MRKRGNLEPLTIEIVGDSYLDMKNTISKKNTRVSEYKGIKNKIKAKITSEMYDKLYYFLSDISLFGMNSSVQKGAMQMFEDKIKKDFFHVMIELETQENLALGTALTNKKLEYFTKNEALLQGEYERRKKEIFSDIIRLIRSNLSHKSSIIGETRKEDVLEMIGDISMYLKTFLTDLKNRKADFLKNGATKNNIGMFIYDFKQK